MWKDEWFITIKDIMRGTLFDVRVDTISEAIRTIDKYNNDSDYEIVAIHRVVTEVYAVDIKSFNIDKYKSETAKKYLNSKFGKESNEKIKEVLYVDTDSIKQGE